MRGSQWFARFGDIPGVHYERAAGVDVRRLRGRRSQPTVRDYGYGETLWWTTPDGDSTQSPASGHVLGERSGATTPQLLTNIAEVLELPGEPSDYHFALQSTAGELYNRRRTDPTTIDQAHRLYLLDLELIQAQSDAVRFDQDDQDRFVSITALGRLLRMYLTEGRVADAVAIADIAERFGAGAMPDVAAARARAAALAAEDAPGAGS